jgi:transcriptional regulator with XRE-family HTH domain
MVNNFNIAQNIRTLREERGYTIEKLAERAGVSANHMSKVENGLRNLSMESLEALNVYPVLIESSDIGDTKEQYILAFINIIKGCSGREASFLLETAACIKENMNKAGFTLRDGTGR